MPTLQEAQAVANRGFAVFPIAAGQKAPPLWSDWPERATRNPTDWPDGANIGVHCDGLLVVDIDPKKGGLESWAALRVDRPVPRTFAVRTPSGGAHLYFRLPAGESVANSVDKLAIGVDVRSRRGYVVAPGSKRHDGEYVVSHNLEIADAPQWLIDAAGRAGDAQRHDLTAVPDAPPYLVDRARQWLTTAERSVRGAGGDHTAYRVACRLRDFGVSYLQACELMRSDAWDHGCGWGPKLEAKPIASAFTYAQSAQPGQKAALPSDFPIVEQAPAQPVATPLLWRIGQVQFQPQPYLIKGLMYKASHVVIYGQPGSGKTFVALDLAHAVASGREWMGRRVRQGPALYVAFEGVGGMLSRMAALGARHAAALDAPLFVTPGQFDLRDKTGRAALGAAIAAMPEPPALIVIDTLARAMMGGDENSAQDIGALNSAVAALIEHSGATVALVHHSGKNEARGARGSSAILGAVDTEIQIAELQLRVTKQRDAPIGEAIDFRLSALELGRDEDGDPITSCVVEPGERRVALPSGPETLRGDARRAWDLLCELRPNNDPITLEEWHQKCEDAFLPTAEGRSKRAMNDIRGRLLARRLIEINEDGLIARKLSDPFTPEE